jgi:hypothetical protein
MRKLSFLLILCLLAAILGCPKDGDEPGQVEPPSTRFVPPEDRKIAEEQALRYIEAAKQSQLVILDFQKRRRAFEEEHNLSPDQSELEDTLFLKEHPQVKEEAIELQNWFQAQMDSVYIRSKISDEEFTWVGGALGDTVNRGIQKKVEKDLNAFAEELEKKGS